MNCPTCGGHGSVLKVSPFNEGTAIRRLYSCACGQRFESIEVQGPLTGHLKSHAENRLKAITASRDRAQRYAPVLARLREGEKHVAVAAEFGLPPTTVTRLAALHGIPTRRSKPLPTGLFKR